MKVLRRIVPGLALLGLAMPAATQGEPSPAPASLVPLPAEVRWTGADFVLEPETRIVVDGTTRGVGEWLAGELAVATGWSLLLVQLPSTADPKRAIVLEVDEALAELGEEGYALSVGPDRIVLRGASTVGVFHGAQTLRQLLPAARTPTARDRTLIVPGVEVRDRPRFAWRGVMLDCSRTFQSVEYLKRTIERMALYKMNVLHLHLTDDQGWRVPIDAYPLLTTKGAHFPDSFGEPAAHQGSYTKAELRELVRYAAARYITIVPEIEMPGHSLAALSCYPELSCTGGPFGIYPFFQGPGITKEIFCAGNDATFDFFAAVLDEVTAIFPSEFVHVGGDEAPKERWEACPKCQARMQAEGLADEHELQSWFIQRAEALIEAHGRRLIGWDEILEGGLAPNATVMSWRGTKGGIAAARAGHDVVMSPTSHCYFDYTYGRIDSERAYAFEPVPAELTGEEATHVLGLQANFWSHIDREPELVDRQLFPRLLALAERAWSPANVRDWSDFRRRQRAQLPRLAALGIAYHVYDALPAAATWTPATTPAEFTEVDWDVSQVVDEAGEWDVLFRYARGAHRLEIEAAAFLVDGEVATADVHLGLTGAQNDANHYRLTLPERPAGARVTLRARVRGGGGTDSTGDVLLVRRR